MDPATETALFRAFSPVQCATSRVHFAGVLGGDGPPVLLLHGYPETHATCPVMVLWPEHQRLVADRGQDDAQTAAAVWRRWADDVREVRIAGGHLLPERAPAAVVDALIPFLA